MREFLHNQLAVCDIAIKALGQRDPHDLLEWFKGRRDGYVIVLQELNRLEALLP